LVVIEIKRTHTGGHMDLQALRYAAMVSSMTFDDVLDLFEEHCRQRRSDVDDPRAELEDFLDGEEGAPLFRPRPAASPLDSGQHLQIRLGQLFVRRELLERL